jgi:hypothetical protein
MSEGPNTYDIDPSRVRVQGAEELDAVALSATVDDRQIRVEARTGAISTREFVLRYDDVDAVDVVRDLSYALVLETVDAEYKITNVTANGDEIDEIAEFVRTRMDKARRDEPRQNGTSPDAASGGQASTSDGQVSAADELQRWVELNEKGVISDAELEEKKEELL